MHRRYTKKRVGDNGLMEVFDSLSGSWLLLSLVIGEAKAKGIDAQEFGGIPIETMQTETPESIETLLAPDGTPGVGLYKGGQSGGGGAEGYYGDPEPAEETPSYDTSCDSGCDIRRSAP